MSGVIGIPANDSARYSFFAASLTGLLHPPNTLIRWAFGSDRIRGRNNLVADALALGAEWLWFLDDDHAFAPDLLLRLLAHQVDIVTPVYLQRMMPFAPVAYTHREGADYFPMHLHDYEPDELVEIHSAGTGGMLIRSEVFRAVGKPWFEHGYASEDLIFCDKARDAGFPIHCDTGARLGHISTCVIWPTVEDGEWQVGLTVADKLSVALPIATREQLAEPVQT